MASKKTKRVAAVTALSASLMMVGAAAFAHEDETVSCPRGKGHGFGTGHKGKGHGQENGWPQKCRDKGNNGGNNNGENNNGGGSNGGGTASDDHNISVDVNIEVGVPGITLPNGGLMVASAVDHAMTAVDQTIMLAENDVALLMDVVEAASEGATSLVDGAAQAGVSVNGTSGSGTLNVSSGALGGATTLGSNLTGSTLNVVNETTTGSKAILGSMLSIL